MSKALVLSGGGARGAFEAGVIAGLRERGERFDIICGTSIGAINGALCAQDDFTTLERMWHSIAARNVISYVPQVRAMRDLIARVEGLRTGPVLHRLWNAAVAYFDYTMLQPLASILKLMGAVAAQPIESVLTEVLDFTRLRATSLIVSATNLTTSSLDVFCWFTDPSQLHTFAEKQTNVAAHSLTLQNYCDAVRASAAIPGAFAPVEITIAGRAYSYVDGGVSNNTPIGQAIDAGATEVTVVFMDPAAQPSLHQVENLAQVGLTSLSVMQQKILDLDMKTAARVNAAAQLGAGGTGSGGARRVVALREIRPARPLAVTVLQFDRQDLLDAAYDAGVNTGRTTPSLSA